MAGARARIQYQWTTANGLNGRVVFVEVDADSPGLVLGGFVNDPAPSVGLGNVLNATIPAAPGSAKKNIFARGVRIQFTGSLPPGRSSDTAWITVFRTLTFTRYALGQVGTFVGLPVECIGKLDGNPKVDGAF